jgi:hypothetical protein
LNQNHQELPSFPCLNGVALVWATSATFIFNYYRVIDSPTFYITRVQAIIVFFFFFFFCVSTLAGPHFLDLVLPFRWFDKEVQGMFQWILVYFNDVFPFLITSMASSNISVVHLPISVIIIHMLTLRCFCLGFWFKRTNIFFILCIMLIWATLPLAWHCQNHYGLRPLGLNLQQVGGVCFVPTKGMNLNFLNLSQEVRNFESLM